MEKLIVSACLLGENCKYDGGNNYQAKIEKLKEKYDIIPICPEVFGGLSTPRDPSEISGDRVISNKGKDVTNNFKEGASKSLILAITNYAEKALLKESSPSCGLNLIHDGTFSGKKIKGMGITARLFLDNGIKIYTENDIDELL